MAPVDRVVAWNAKVGRSDAEIVSSLKDLIAYTHPQVICLQEAGGYIDALRSSFAERWRVYSKGGWEEARMNPVMVRRRWPKQKYGTGWGTLRTKTAWVGPQGGTHYGRTWTWVTVDDLLVMSLHRCTDGNGANARAFQEEAAKLTRFIDRQATPLLVIGDHNCGVQRRHEGASKLVAADTGSRLVFDPANPGIDYGIARAVTGSVEHGKRYGSDHPCTVFTRT